MFIVVSYDIPQDKRRTKLMKTLKDYCTHVKYSVFECELKPEVYKAMRQRIDKLIVPKEDRVRFYFLDEDAIAKIDSIGNQTVLRVQEYYVIGD